MSRLSLLSVPVSPSEDESDGRRRRSQDSRARIVAALLELVQGGELSPSAEQVAARARVGLRSVFRHFKDMDSLYREMSLIVEQELATIIDRPLASQAPVDRILELVARRAEAFERIAPFKRAGDLIRHRSPFLEAAHVRMNVIARETLRRELPAAVVADRPLLEAIDLLLSWQTWQRLRRDQGLTSKGAREVLETAISRLIAGPA